MNSLGTTTSGEPNIRRWLVALLFVHATMLAYGARIHGPGWDEAGHLPAGISHWQLGNTDLYRVNPPLARMVATIPLAPFDYSVNWTWDSSDTVARPEWTMGVQLWQAHGMDVYWYLTVARWMSIPWSLLAAYIIYTWSSQLYGRRAGLFSTVLWCFSPLVLTNAQMMTPDSAAAALGVCAAFAFWKWMHVGDLSSTYVAGLLLGLAELTKTTWIILLSFCNLSDQAQLLNDVL
ncbi:MAG: glycosyltransferase family 39 protein, partial [Planctomycetota bacterium]